MPSYYAHEWFGERVLEQLPTDICRAIEEDTEAFKTGLYGPDPVMFAPGGPSRARVLGRFWREDAAETLHTMLNEGSDGEKSFAAGYLCHLVLDDSCHACIHRFQREQGLSHCSMELGLDWILIRENQEKKFPPMKIPHKNRVVKLAAKLIQPTTHAWQYRIGLTCMSLVTVKLTAIAKLYMKKNAKSYEAPLVELREILNERIGAAVKALTALYVSEYKWNAKDYLLQMA
ncbi:MAG: zinc dependent phospholipase C family protein [Evtepia sp.]